MVWVGDGWCFLLQPHGEGPCRGKLYIYIYIYVYIYKYVFSLELLRRGGNMEAKGGNPQRREILANMIGLLVPCQWGGDASCWPPFVLETCVWKPRGRTLAAPFGQKTAKNMKEYERLLMNKV